MIPLIKSNISKIVKDTPSILGALISYDLILKQKDFKDRNEKMSFLASIKVELMQLINLETFNKFPDEPLDVLRHYFQFYASNDDLLVEGLKFFNLFPSILRANKFNSVKAFLFYFAYQTKRYNKPPVKNLLEQELLNVNITESKVYLEFCMYCFYKGLYYIEKRDFFMASYLYCTAVSMGLRGNTDDAIVFNQFSLQMMRNLCFLKSLTEYDIKNALFKERNMSHYSNDLVKYETVDEMINYIKNEKNDLNAFNTFTKSNKEMIENCKLKGLRNEAEEALIFRKIKETLFLYKKIKMSKLSQLTQIEFNDLMKVIKKKVISGEINVKYDEASDILEVFNVDPGLKERVQKTKDLYNKIIEANKNLFLTIKDKKADDLNKGNLSNEEAELLNRKHPHYEDYAEEDYAGMDLDED